MYSCDIDQLSLCWVRGGEVHMCTFARAHIFSVSVTQ